MLANLKWEPIRRQVSLWVAGERDVLPEPEVKAGEEE
jgi:hypothetical protein